MAVSQATAIPSIAEMAQEKLEKLQIRRENQALLERINSIGAQRDKDLEDIRQQYEAALESNKETVARIDELEQKVADRDREVDDFVEDLQRFKGTVEEFLRTRASEEEIEDVMSAATAGRYSSSFMRGLDPEDEPRGSIESPGPSTLTRPPRRAANRKSSFVPRERNIPQLTSEASAQEMAGPSERASAVKESFKKPNLAADPVLSNPSTNNRKRPTTTRPTDTEPQRPSPMMTCQRSRSLSRELSHFAAPAQAAPGPPKIPKLSQDRRPLGAYYKASTVIHASLGLDGGQPEFDFISSFINGMSSKKEMNQLLDSLANFCFCDTKDDGTREILCTWDEVLDGLKAAELVSDENGSQDKGKGKAALNSAAAPTAVDTPIASNPRAAEKLSVAEHPTARGSKGGKTPNGTDHPAGGRERRDLKKTADRSGRSGNGSGSTGSGAVEKLDSGNAKSGAAIEKPGPRKANVSEKSSRAKGKANSRVATRPAPKKGKAATAASTVDLDGPNSGSPVGNGAAAEGFARGSRRGLPRAAKR